MSIVRIRRILCAAALAAAAGLLAYGDEDAAGPPHGVRFEASHIRLTDLLAKAKATGKLVFVDVSQPG